MNYNKFYISTKDRRNQNDRETYLNAVLTLGLLGLLAGVITLILIMIK